ncbi:MAG TPA: nucleotidyl transferase AbiEii/AbiGii toxin family protein, partial [Gammaproteobacteria bacterium]|nr:nucleotidyl transferase AbiEii/AbiGii toxin family protein [Gammaproteobacteria bacterium]
KNKLDKVVRTAFLKAESTGGILILKDSSTQRKKLQIKLEIDTHPPQGSNYELKYLDFPLPYGIKAQDLPSLFAGKIHALLSRPYTKGRDWYDFIWYVSRQTSINLPLLTHAFAQHTPGVILNATSMLEALKDKINHTDWIDAKKDIARFLRPRELPTLDLWSKDFFLSCVEKIRNLNNDTHI